MKPLLRIHITLAIFLTLSIFAVAQQAANEGHQVLPLHDVEAVFVGTHFKLCKSKKTLCSYQCGGSDIVAAFRVLHYNDYQ